MRWQEREVYNMYIRVWKRSWRPRLDGLGSLRRFCHVQEGLTPQLGSIRRMKGEKAALLSACRPSIRHRPLSALEYLMRRHFPNGNFIYLYYEYETYHQSPSGIRFSLLLIRYLYEPIYTCTVDEMHRC